MFLSPTLHKIEKYWIFLNLIAIFLAYLACGRLIGSRQGNYMDLLLSIVVGTIPTNIYLIRLWIVFGSGFLQQTLISAIARVLMVMT